MLEMPTIPMGEAPTIKELIDLGDKRSEVCYFNRPEKQVVCFSTQLSCAVGCAFCASPGEEKTINLTPAEMIQQCYTILHGRHERDKVILFSIMGEGEPLLNFHNVVTTMQIIPTLFPNSRLALSTSGVATSRIIELAGIEFTVPFKLQVSMHSFDDAIRTELMPLARPVQEVIDATDLYRRTRPDRFVELNIALMDGINDRDEDLDLIRKYLDTSWYLKLGQFNHVSGLKYSGSRRIVEFAEALRQDGYTVECHASDGSTVGAACGQTRGEFIGKIR